MRARLMLALEALGIDRDGDVLAAIAPWRNRSRSSSRSRRPASSAAVLPPSATIDRLQHLDGAARRVLLDDAGAFDQEDEGRGAAVHDRHFGPVELDRPRCRSRDRPSAAIRCSMVAIDRPSPLSSTRAQRLLDRIAPVGRDLRAGTIGAAEDDAGVRRAGCRVIATRARNEARRRDNGSQILASCCSGDPHVVPNNSRLNFWLKQPSLSNGRKL